MGACIGSPANNLDINAFDYATMDICGDIHACKSLKQFSDSMINYMEFGAVPSNIQNIVDHYIHLIHKHDTDKDFQFIVDTLGICDILKCERFRRNYRNRNSKNSNEMSVKDNAIRQIFDKMHCYFAHCFEIGYRLSSQERAIIDTDADDEKSNDNDIEALLVNNKLIKMKEILQTKLQNIDIDLRERINGSRKYTQLMLNPEEDDTKTMDDNKIFCTGYMFVYYDTETQMHADDYRMPEDIPILPIHSSLKEELTQNKICIITLEQFQYEYEKAKLHFNSNHRKVHYPKMTLDWLLVVMFYCNYDHLQYFFSKTYREHKGKDHGNFYWMGKYLQSAVYNNNGDDASNIPSLYHGVSEELVVVMSNQQRNYTISIYSPLSTTSTFEVAMNFASNNHDQGLVIEFNDQELNSHSNEWEKRCLSCSWVSDYGNEREYLFVQTNTYVFNVTNITHTDSGIDYFLITKCLTLIELCIQRPAHIQQILEDFTKGMPLLMVDIVRYQLAQSLAEMNAKRFIIDAYSKKLCSAHFGRVKCIEMPWKIEGFADDLSIFESFYQSKQAINLKNIIALYPNLETIATGYGDADINDDMMNTLLDDWINIGTKTLKRINIALQRSTEISTLIDFVDKYSKQYQEIGLSVTGFIVTDLRSETFAVVPGSVEISNRNVSELTSHLIQTMDMGVIYLKDDENVMNVEDINTIFPNLEKISVSIRNLGLSIYIKKIGENRMLLFVVENEEDANRWYNTIKKSLQCNDEHDQHGLQTLLTYITVSEFE